MNYKSTRSDITADSKTAVLQGLAPDGGLYIDPRLQERGFDWRHCLELSPLGMAEMILKHTLPDFEGMGELVKKAYEGKFSSPQLTPLVEVGENYVLELFHGPTCAFKDVALSMLPQLITAARAQQKLNDKVLILTATSGDTGKAALEGFHDVDGTEIIVFYPEEGVSPIQKAQMQSQSGKNVKVCALKGNFDDCQRGVKEAFAEINSKNLLEGKAVRLSSANSINIGRLAPQIVYYFIAYAALIKKGRIKPGEEVDFVVPTGNFGDILAGYYAKLMGLPVGTLVCASNANKVLTDFVRTGVYDKNRKFIKTSSPSMDILVSSNLERLLYYASEGNSDFVKSSMESLSAWGSFRLDLDTLLNVQESIEAYCCDEEGTAKFIKKVWDENKYLCDPHTAVAFSAAEDYKKNRWGNAPVVVLSTASPFKFPQAVLSALGEDAEGDEFKMMEKLSQISGRAVPPSLAGLEGKEILHKDVIEKGEITSYVLNTLSQWEA